MQDLAGKRILVTGASSGIGWELAKAFAAQDGRLALLARRRERLERLAKEIGESGGGPPLVVEADLAVRGQAAEAGAHVESELGGVDVLINNAGGAVGGSVWAVADSEEARTAFEVGFWSPLALIGALVPAMRQRESGVVANVTSISQIATWASFGQNSAIKSALAQATETLRIELKRFHVHVVEVIPGPIETPAQGPTQLMPGIVDSIHGRLGMGSPAEIAQRVVEAVKREEDRVFWPEITTRQMYENPVKTRADIATDVEQVLASLPPNDAIDDVIIGADNPLILNAREAWEREHGIGV